METLTMNMVQTTGFAIIVLLIGMLVRKKVRFFTKYCIPAPVIGGLIFSIVTTILRSANILEFDFDTTLQSFFQIMYFCTIGFAASFKMLKVGGSKVVKFLVIASIFALLQDVLAVGLADTVGIEPLLALMTASHLDRRHGNIGGGGPQRGGAGIFRRHHCGGNRGHIRYPVWLGDGRPRGNPAD